MERDKLRSEFVTMIQPFVRKLATDQIKDDTLLIEDLNVNSARLVDIMLEMEDRFAIRIEDEEGSALTTVGSAIDLIAAKTAAGGLRL
jgi:acyl carrier protein